MRNMTSRSPRLLARLRELRQLCEDEGVVISNRHIPSVLNTWADRLSRLRDNHGWELPPTAARLLECRYRRLLFACDGHEMPSYTHVSRAHRPPAPDFAACMVTPSTKSGSRYSSRPCVAWPKLVPASHRPRSNRHGSTGRSHRSVAVDSHRLREAARLRWKLDGTAVWHNCQLLLYTLDLQLDLDLAVRYGPYSVRARISYSARRHTCTTRVLSAQWLTVLQCGTTCTGTVARYCTIV